MAAVATSGDVETRRCASFALNNLAANPKNHVVFERLGILRPLVQLAMDEDTDTQLQAGWLLGWAVATLVWVSTHHLFVGLLLFCQAVVAIRRLALNSKNRSRLAGEGVFAALLKLSSSASVEVQRETTAAFRNLSLSERNKVEIVNTGCLSALVNAAHR